MLMHLNTSRERIFDKEVATKFENILSKGGTEHPMTLYKCLEVKNLSLMLC
jgi:Zn-dependent oligopeptidase